MGEERLTDTHRRALCELIGEEWANEDPFKGWVNAFASNRTFTTWEDYGRCIEAIKAKGLWEEREEWAIEHWQDDRDKEDYFIPWLQDPARCRKVAEWLEERGREGEGK